MNDTTLVTILLTAGIVTIALTWFYEHELHKLNVLLDDARCEALDKTYELLQAKALVESYADHNLSEAVRRSSETFEDHLATLFDAELMQGNQD